MVLTRTRLAHAALLIALGSLSGPAMAHKDHHNKPQVGQAKAAQPVASSAQPMHSRGDAHPFKSDSVNPQSAVEEDSAGGRFLSWLGRLHPIIVHFPIAFFPAALFTALVGRRRPSFAAPVQFLVVTGAILAPLSALLGWLDAISMDPDPLLTVHRWLGTAIGVLAAPLAVWAWRKPEQDRSWLMIGSLTVLTTAIVVQGWYGGALVHGMDHLNW